MKVKINLENDGMAMFYRPYEVIGWDVVWNSPGPIGSGAVWKGINQVLWRSEDSISRASVIFFLNRQVDLGFMGWKDGTGKGGHHRLYYPKVGMKDLVLAISRYFSIEVSELIARAQEYDEGIQK